MCSFLCVHVSEKNRGLRNPNSRATGSVGNEPLAVWFQWEGRNRSSPGWDFPILYLTQWLQCIFFFLIDFTLKDHLQNITHSMRQKISILKRHIKCYPFYNCIPIIFMIFFSSINFMIFYYFFKNKYVWICLLVKMAASKLERTIFCIAISLVWCIPVYMH
jgi:hypothetical protein